MTTRALKLNSAWASKLKLLPAKAKVPQQKSELEEEFAIQIKLAKLPEPKREYRFSKRRWRFDFAWVPQCVAVELVGGTYTQGRHTRGKGYAADREKANEAQLLGWICLEATAAHVKSGKALQWLERALI